MENAKTCSQIFTGARVLGYVSTHVPFVARFIKRRGETLLCTSVGKWFHTYGCDKFRLLSVSGEHPSEITCMSGDGYHIYTGCENNIYAWRRGCELKHIYKGHGATIHKILPFGIHIISVDESNVLKVFDIKDETEFLELKFSLETFTITTLCHPPTYLNKILLGSKQGQLQLWNIRTSKLVYTLKGWGSEVLVTEPAPAVDVVAIALENSKIFLHNIKLDQTIMNFIHDWGQVSSLSFRMDGAPIMVTGSSTGNIVMWDLEERTVKSQIQAAHSAAIAGLQCLMSEPLMVTNSQDNSLKMWIFDMPDGGARLLKKREGHALPPKLIRYCEPSGENILAAGSDSSLHIMNTVTETFNKSMGKASFDRKKSKKKNNLTLPPITQLSSCMQRDKQWDSIATLHENKKLALTWSYNRICVGKHKLRCPFEEKKAVATSLTVTHCGNFVIIATSPYHVMRLDESVNKTKCHRESALLALANEDFTITLIDIDTMKVVRKFDGHVGKITDIDFDYQSRWLVSSSMDCTICTWDIPSAQLVDVFMVEAPCTSLKLPTTAPEKPDLEDIGVIDLGEPEYKSPEQISTELITLSGQPTSRWLNLLNLDIVKRRNKPKTPLTVPKSAPFFLPTIPSLELEFDLEKEKGDTNKKLLTPESLSTLTPFAKKLNKCKRVFDYDKCVMKLKEMSPAAIEAEVTSMAPDAGGSIEVMSHFLKLIDSMLKSNRDFELAQSYLSLFLKVHTKVITRSSELLVVLHCVEESSSVAWSRLQNSLLYNICVVKALKDM
ncbi:unnamed protein product [Leptidea sinapis]|uniref:Small-subunit processome Utp21 domain-containing protein n=1 Tax=Leptidea sinapis TaxID=189913 RepID=A0A5E4QYV5_9NEOP|nr:unnamed protein product [Leptidea sinapis]